MPSEGTAPQTAVTFPLNTPCPYYMRVYLFMCIDFLFFPQFILPAQRFPRRRRLLRFATKPSIHSYHPSNKDHRPFSDAILESSPAANDEKSGGSRAYNVMATRISLRKLYGRNQ
ncbi:uncharacterized protein BO66DRAFT_395545 [Aspergillus aculeatinus CBS 121060]|uniref:Uncharacterized protein n=1 Tax=Aspergillus aculeatinus CBS 121060 TaxID=1448322 RepID=A0ACD1GVT8_9EURO|nr:hypothetical protein BO66DRAFT_395545 [Aspergillus aculeatinus CBS 121060]RAH65316.1 hypothetical protein BO66DRAFT_395545 [Aspergillus aculeatinus CBS 121060]